jgi:hypothetical protein
MKEILNRIQPMNNEEYFKEMYSNIWQRHNLNKIDNYYAKDFEEIISVFDEKKILLKLKCNILILLSKQSGKKKIIIT